jgi:hypothetical protein
VIFCGPAKKVTIRLHTNDAMAASICEALLAFLGPKDVCCVQMSFPESAMAIRFLARQGKVDALTDIARLIAPNALIYAENTTIVHAATDSRRDLRHERAVWESSLPIRSDRAASTNGSGPFGEEHSRSTSKRSGRDSSTDAGRGGA